MNFSTFNQWFVILAVAVLASCGKTEKETGNNSNQEQLELSPSEQLVAQWSGVYNTVDGGEASSEPFAVTANFTSDFHFEIYLENDTNAKAVGTWTEFQGKTLILKLSGSTLSAIGSAGKIVETNLDIIGNTLRIRNRSFDLRLSKKSTTNPPAETIGGDHSFTGTWACNDPAGRRTKVSIDEKNIFKLSSLRSGERAFVASGEVSVVTNAEVVLKVMSSSDPLASESFFQLQKVAQNTRLTLSAPNRAPVQLGNCQK